MSSRFLRLLLVLIAFMAFDGHSNDIRPFTSADYEFAKNPDLRIEPLQNPASRGSFKQLNYIADPFFPIVVLAFSLYEERDFTFYLPRYELHHENQFFLLI